MSVLDRAGLLRALAAVPGQHQSAMARVFDCELGTPSAQLNESGQPVATASGEIESAGTALHTARTPPLYWLLTQATPLQQIDPELSELKPRSHSYPDELWPETPPDVCCLAESRWQLLWDDLLSVSVPGRQIDIPAAVEHVARNKPVYRLPRQQSRHPAERIVLLLDIDPDIEPAWSLYPEMLQSLRQRVSQDLLTILEVDADGVCHNTENGRLANPLDPCQGAHVLAFGAFGSIHNDGKASANWTFLLDQVALVAQQVQACGFCNVHLDNLAVVPVETGRPESSLPLLLQVLCRCWMLDAEFLWQIRSIHPDVSISDILTLYNHPDLTDRDPYLSLSPAAIEALLSSCPQQMLAQNIVEHLKPFLWRTEFQAAHLQTALQAPECLSVDDIPWLESLAAVATEEQVQHASASMAQGVIGSLLPLFKCYAKNTDDRRWRGLLNAAQAVAANSGQALPLGPLNLRGNHTLGVVTQSGRSLVLAASEKPGLLAISDRCFCERSEKILDQTWQENGDTAVLVDRDVRYQFVPSEKPHWARRCFSDNARYYATPDDQLFLQFVPANALMPVGGWHLDKTKGTTWANAAGTDEHGLWAELTVDGVSLRLRWIEPGSFQMGSPSTEEGRSDDETLHKVTLTSGYWLAETSCTKAFWSAVEGTIGQDSGVSGEQRPQVDVSWDECRVWIEKLNEQLPGFQARLPTEAEWEYACRARTHKAYWWGSDYDKTYANNGTPVEEHDYPANPWGLKSMSGNVLEWCSDWYGDYPNRDVIDPAGPDGGRRRVLRGGFWLSGGRDRRSAYRLHYSPDFRSLLTGLRLAGGTDPQAIAGNEWATTADRALRSSDQGGGHGTRTGAGEADK